MKRILTCLVVLFLTTIILSCTAKKSLQTTNTRHLDELFEFMSGSFSSADQAKEDSTYYNIHLTMFPIWTSDKNAKWLYVEQAVASQMKKPYRQRVYRVTELPSGKFESKVYTLPDPERVVHGWENATVFTKFTSADLVERAGCAVILERTTDNCYQGSTNEKDCRSTMRGAHYATSEVRICADGIMSWDRGWNERDEYVWGAEKAGYQFDRK